MPSPRDLARAQALGRVGLGVALTLFPRRTPAPWIGGRDARRTGTAVITSAMGAREIGIGLGAARAAGAGFGAKPWLFASALADATDLLVTWRARRELPALGVATLAAMAGGSTVLAIWLSRELD